MLTEISGIAVFLHFLRDYVGGNTRRSLRGCSSNYRPWNSA